MTATVTPTRLPGLRAVADRALERLLEWKLPARPAPIAAVVALLAAGAAGVLVALGPLPDELSTIAVVPTVSATPARAG